MTGVQTCALPISASAGRTSESSGGIERDALAAPGPEERRCEGKFCQANSPGASQFAPVGSLGGLASFDGLGSLDGGASLDGLLKNEKGALDASLESLDAATASAQAAAAVELTEQGGGIQGPNEADLFARMHHFHERAQRRGMVLGLTRKL